VETVRSGKRPRKSKARAHAARGARYQCHWGQVLNYECCCCPSCCTILLMVE
jgi:hypothetical protein